MQETNKKSRKQNKKNQNKTVEQPTLETELLDTADPVYLEDEIFEEQPDEELVTIFIPYHTGMEARPKKMNGETKHFIHGAINGKKFEVPCDEPVEVPISVAERLHALPRSE